MLYVLQYKSVDCGILTSCVKIYKKSEGHDESGAFIPLEERGASTTLYRGE